MTTFDDLVSAQLMRYFVVERGYLPVVVKSHKNEVFLQRVDDPKIQLIRITPEPIIYGGQVSSDEERIVEVVGMLKHTGTLAKVNVLNIYTSPTFTKPETSKYKNIISTSTKSEIGHVDLIDKLFPEMHEHIKFAPDMEKEFKVIMKEISDHTKETHSRMSKLITTKWPIATYVILGLLVGFYVFGSVIVESVPSINMPQFVISQGAANFSLIFGAGQLWRLVTAAFVVTDTVNMIFAMIIMFKLSRSTEASFGWLRTLIIVAFGIFVGNLSATIFNQSTITFGQQTIVASMLGAVLYFGSQNKIIFTKFIFKNTFLPILYLGFMVISFGMTDFVSILFALAGGYFIAMITSWKGTLPNKFAIVGIAMTLSMTIGLFGLANVREPQYMNYENFEQDWIEYTRFLGEDKEQVGKAICEFYKIEEGVCKWK